MSKTFPRNMKNLPPTAVSAQGCYIYDRSGKPYLDGSGGAAVSCLGHGDPDIIAAIKAQTDRLSFAHTGFFTSEPSVEQKYPINTNRLNEEWKGHGCSNSGI